MLKLGKILFFCNFNILIASSILKVPKASTFAEYSGISKLVCTCDCAPKL